MRKAMIAVEVIGKGYFCEEKKRTHTSYLDVYELHGEAVPAPVTPVDCVHR